MEEGELVKAAAELAEALNRMADENLPGKLAGIVKLHAGIAVGSAFIPIPGVDMAAAVANIWTMYVRINKELDLPFAENVIKSLATGVVTNIAGGVAAALVFEGALKLVPGLGTLAGGALMAATAYAITIASGIVYMKAVAMILTKKTAAQANEHDLKAATDAIVGDGDLVKGVLRAAREEYKSQPAPSRLPPRGVFQAVQLRQAVDVSGEERLYLTFSFSVQGYRGKTLRAVSYFFHPAGDAVRDTDGRYRTADGGVSVTGNQYLVEWDNATCANWSLEIPVEQLHLTPGKHALKYQIGIFCEENQAFAAISKYVIFDVNVSEPNT